MMSDDFQKEKQEISTGLNKKSSLDALKSSPIQVSQKILERKCKTIFLINDNTVYHYDEQFDIDLCQNHFFKEIFQSFNKTQYEFHYINTSNPITYKLFISCLIEYCIGNQFDYNDIMNSFQFIQMSEINNNLILKLFY